MSVTPRYTSADLEGLPDHAGVRYEIVDGELFVSKQPSLEHQYTSDEIQTSLRNWTRQTGTGLAISAPGLIFAADDDVAPDVVWISHARLVNSVDEAGHLHVAPELIVEVLSPGQRNARRDREVKLRLYSRQGVQEYWIVDCLNRCAQVYRRTRTALRLIATLGGNDELTSPLLPDFRCPLPSIWYARR